MLLGTTGAAVLILVLFSCSRVKAVCEGNRTCSYLHKRSLLFTEKTVCYPNLGCFSNGPPFYHPVYRPLSLPPQSPEIIGTTFLLYTRRNRNRPIFLHQHRLKNVVYKSTFDPKALTRVIIHGFNDNQAISSWFRRLKDVILDRADENVLIVDWSGSNRLPYTVTVANSRVVGAQIANFIKALYKTNGVSPESFHLIGHSLGAHIAGYAGERLYKLGRITGLDPAGPLFRNVPEVVRLDPKDAVFVDVIHSDPGSSILQGLGINEDCGHLDFYPAGGDPPGCGNLVASSLAEKMPVEALGDLFSCQHLRSYDFFIFSFNQKGCLFVGVECTSWDDFLSGHCNCGRQGEKCAMMGHFSPIHAYRKGRHYKDRRLYLKVGPERPYCIHQYQVILYMHTYSERKTYGYESTYAEVNILGKHAKLKGRIRLGVNLSGEKQVKKFLLSTDRSIGHVLSASITLEGRSNHQSISYPQHLIIDSVEINYLYPLPKDIVSSKLCRRDELTYNAGEKRFIYSPKSCY